MTICQYTIAKLSNDILFFVLSQSVSCDTFVVATGSRRGVAWTFTQAWADGSGRRGSAPGSPRPSSERGWAGRPAPSTAMRQASGDCPSTTWSASVGSSASRQRNCWPPHERPAVGAGGPTRQASAPRGSPPRRRGLSATSATGSPTPSLVPTFPKWVMPGQTTRPPTVRAGSRSTWTASRPSGSVRSSEAPGGTGRSTCRLSAGTRP